MEIKETLQIKDTNKIKDIHFKHPELMSKSAKNRIKKLFYNIYKTQRILHEERDKVIKLEIKLKTLQKEFNTLSCLFDIEYETTTKEIVRETEGFGIRGLGNDVIGRQTVI